MNKAQFGLVPTACPPAILTAQVTIDAIPHHLADETANGLKARYPVEFGHSERRIVAMPLVNQASPLLHIGFPATGSDQWILGHTIHQNLKIAGGQPQIQIQLAKIGKIAGIYRRIS